MWIKFLVHDKKYKMAYSYKSLLYNALVYVGEVWGVIHYNSIS